MAPVDYLSDEKNHPRKTCLYVTPGSFHVLGVEKSGVPSNGKPTNGVWSAVDSTSSNEATAAIGNEDHSAPISLPLESDSAEIDVHLQRGFIPALFETNQLLRNQKPTVFSDQMDTVESEQISETCRISVYAGTEHSIEPTVLYVAQGEIAHCTFNQADVVVSDRATTCHVLALHSRSGSAIPYPSFKDVVPLSTMMHFDACTYDSCVRNAVELHATHHHRHWSSRTTADSFEIYLDIHLVGGFNDNDATSRKITLWIMNLLIEIAQEYHVTMPTMKMVLRTACVTAANHDPFHNGPVVRGLGLVCRTGQIMVAHCVNPGPAMTLRMARLWVRGHGTHRCHETLSESKLSLIHTSESECITIAPLFPLACHCRCGFLQNDAKQEFEYLLQLRDDKSFLKYCSTSPEHEEEDFCKSNRASFRYILQHFKQADLFTSIPPGASRHYRRAHRSSNEWLIQVDDVIPERL
jgi:Protein N-terminal asparagine amidohydrolase